MKPLIFVLLATLACIAPLRAQTTTPEAIDFDKARQLVERAKGGATLTDDEKAYVRRAQAERANPPGSAGSGIDWDKARILHQREQRGDKLTDEERRYLDQAKAARSKSTDSASGGAVAAQRKAPAHLTPLSDMTGTDTYEGEDGGLYGGGSNQPPEALRKSAEAALTKIQPLDAAGKPAADGRVGFVSISMSNATMEFSAFKRTADAAPQKSNSLTIVDCAQGGQAMAEWVDPQARTWQEALQRIQRAGLTPAQVQVAWVKLANKGPSGSMKDHLTILEADTTRVLQNAKAKFPNLRIAYLGSRIWAGNANGALNPEPYAYESAFGVRHLIQQQMKGEAALADGKAPLLLWGPYLWAEGTKGRKTDNLVWAREDFAGDGVHPSDSGRAKVAKLLLDFFSTEPLAKGWFAH